LNVFLARRIGRQAPRAPQSLVFAACTVFAICALPIIALLIVALTPQTELWAHILTYVLPYAVRDTLLLVLGVAVLTSVIGVTLAALVSLTEFPGRKFIAAAAILPLAFPTYLYAFVSVELLDAAGPVQSAMRAWFGPWAGLPEIRSIGGAILIFSLVLFPYVYLPLALAFAAQTSSYRNAARVLGCSPLSAFFRVQLPAVRATFIAGLALALMETLADFGASEYLGVRTFAYTTYTTWITRGSLAGAAQIALILIAVVAALAALEAHSRTQVSRQMKSSKSNPAPRTELRGTARFAASAFGVTIVMLAFALPAGFLCFTALASSASAAAFGDLSPVLMTTCLLAAAGASIIVLCAGAIALLQRWQRDGHVQHAANVSTLGYAVPGVVMALGVVYASGAIDNGVDRLMRDSFGISTGLLIGGTPAILLIAYLVRFLAVGHGPIHARMQQISPSLDYAARTLGRKPFEAAREALLPQMRTTLTAAWLLLAVDIMKELPMTLLLRPLGIDTLATTLYGFASSGQFEDGSVEALAILICGLIGVLVLQRLMRLGGEVMAANN
jgi:iron(III) transport system permease protein